jgi:uroporphyrinogen-III synthase
MKHVLVTRAPHQAGALVTMLRRKGVQPVCYPCIEIVPPADTSALESALRNWFDWLLLTSSNTVHALAARSDELKVRRVAAVGPKTAAQAETRLGLTVAHVPGEHTADALAASLPVMPGMRVLLPQSARADNTLAHALSARGAEVCIVTAYENVIGTGGDPLPDRIDALTFTSASTVENFVIRWEYEGRAPIYNCPALCIGPSTAATAHDCGFQQVRVPETYTLEAMVERLMKVID